MFAAEIDPVHSGARIEWKHLSSDTPQFLEQFNRITVSQNRKKKLKLEIR